MSDLLLAFAVAVVTGAVSTFGTVMALKIHIVYLRENINRIDESLNRAHARIDDMEKH